MGKSQVSITRTIATTPDQIFELLVDPLKHPLIDGSGTVRVAREGSPARLELGSKFGMEMKMGATYKITNTVVEYEENRLIAWRHFMGHRWRWQLKPVEAGTEVTETFDWSTARSPFLMGLSPFPRKNREGIDNTLTRLSAMFPNGDGGGERK